MYLIWQLSPRHMLCGFRATKQEAAEYISLLLVKQKNATFDIQEKRK